MSLKIRKLLRNFREKKFQKKFVNFPSTFIGLSKKSVRTVKLLTISLKRKASKRIKHILKTER